MTVRDAVADDFEELTAIYNEIVANSTAVYRDDPTTVAERIAWWQARKQRGFPTLVACIDERVAGFASFGEFRHAPGYRYTVEHTVHVDAERRGRGVGSALLQALVERAGAMGIHAMVGAVDAANTGSLAFHERLGFLRVAEFKEVGFKFGRFLDLVFMERIVAAGGERAG